MRKNECNKHLDVTALINKTKQCDIKGEPPEALKTTNKNCKQRFD